MMIPMMDGDGDAHDDGNDHGVSPWLRHLVAFGRSKRLVSATNTLRQYRLHRLIGYFELILNNFMSLLHRTSKTPDKGSEEVAAMRGCIRPQSPTHGPPRAAVGRGIQPRHAKTNKSARVGHGFFKRMTFLMAASSALWNTQPFFDHPGCSLRMCALAFATGVSVLIDHIATPSAKVVSTRFCT